MLADLLGQEEIRALGQKAAETARLLKAGLSFIRQEQAGVEDETQRVQASMLRLEAAGSWFSAAESAKRAAQAAVEAAQGRHVRLVAEREQSEATAARRDQLAAERRSVLDAADQAVAALAAQDQAELQRQERLALRAAGRLQQERQRRQALTQSRQRCLGTLADAGSIRRASRRLSLVQTVQELRTERTVSYRGRVQTLTQHQGAVRLAEQTLASIEREVGREVLKARELAHRLALTGAVPCSGTDLQGRCKLLGDAHEARALIPSARAQVERLARDKAQVIEELRAARRQCETLAGAPQALACAEHREAVAREHVDRLGMLASKELACAQAWATLAEVDRELAMLGPEVASGAVVETPEERAERQQIAASRQAIAAQLDRQPRHAPATLERLDRTLAALPPPYDHRQLASAEQSLNAARAGLVAAERALMAAVRDAQVREELSRQAATLAVRRKAIRARSAHVGDELANWNLFARCMSNDGLIALTIDDAGPTLSALANDLLLSCYGPRFTVSIHTLLETARGEQKEGFDIVVFDGETGESKSVRLMSGGERTFVEACMTRAIALYLVRHTGRRYATLFTDEADGALDPERKRMFMAMKREVLRLGGYEREFFVSQTPELTAMADAVIDLDALKLSDDVSTGATGARCRSNAAEAPAWRSAGACGPTTHRT